MLAQLKEKVYWLPGENNSANAYILLGEKKAVIDPGLKSNRERVEAALEELKLGFDEIDLVVITHAHVDHFGLAGAFGKAEVLMHREGLKRLKGKDALYACADYFPGEACDFPAEVEGVEEGDEIDLGGIKLSVFHTPGHAIGCICLLEKRLEILFSGDTIFKDAWGRTDLETSDKKALIDSLHKIAQLNYQILAPGHGAIIPSNAPENLSGLLELID